MLFKSKNLFFSIFSIAFLVGCGEKKGNKNPSVPVNTTKSYFVMNKWGNTSSLYSFDFATKEMNLEISNKLNSGDSIVFQKYDSLNNLQGVYFVERFSMQYPSRVTYYSSLLNDSGKENTQFPMNMHGMIFVGNKLIGVGYDKGEIVQTDPTMQTSYLTKTEIIGLIGKDVGYPIDSSANISSLLYANGKVFAVSQGSYCDHNMKPYIYQLSDDLKSVEKTWPIDDCFNASEHFKVIDESKLVISCNPYENGLSKNTMNVFLIDTSTVQSSENPFIVRVLEKERIDGGIQQINIGGISADRNSIFVSEKKKLNSGDKYSYKALISSYWVDLSNSSSILVNEGSRITPVNVVSGSVTYNYAAKSYLFSCDVAPDFTCVKGKGAVSQSMDAANRIQVDFNSKGNDDIKFPIPVF